MISIIDREPQVKNSESTIKNKLKSSLNEMKVFKFVIALVLKLKKRNNKHKTKYSTFFQAQRQKQLFTTQTLVICLNQSVIPVWQKEKSIR